MAILNGIYGLGASCGHKQNGMTLKDMQACVTTARQLDEVIIFRSTGPWSMRWIERNYPTKNFHVKGKSSDWGPQAGFVPYKAEYSKVGHVEKTLAKYTGFNDEGIHESYASTTQLTLSEEELRVQLTQISDGRTALTSMMQVPNTRDYFLTAMRSGDNKKFSFLASWFEGKFRISVYENRTPANAGAVNYELGAEFKPVPLQVMTSSEVGAANKPLTGDYDLMSICPRWKNYGSYSTAVIAKEGVNFGRTEAPQGQSYGIGSAMDKVLDMRLNTGALPHKKPGAITPQSFDKTWSAKNGQNSVHDRARHDMNQMNAEAGRTQNTQPFAEHADMGNLTPRILRAINTLNASMGQSGPFRRVHHNAESHRNHMFGAITEAEMKSGDGVPLTVFLPDNVDKDNVVTLETVGDFKNYAAFLHEKGFFVPKNWVWGMSIRNNLPTDLSKYTGRNSS